jgi:hypothetical protein
MDENKGVRIVGWRRVGKGGTMAQKDGGTGEVETGEVDKTNNGVEE